MEVRIKKFNVHFTLKGGGAYYQRYIIEVILAMFPEQTQIIADGGDNFEYQGKHTNYLGERLFATIFDLNIISDKHIAVLQWHPNFYGDPKPAHIHDIDKERLKKWATYVRKIDSRH